MSFSLVPQYFQQTKQEASEWTPPHEEPSTGTLAGRGQYPEVTDATVHYLKEKILDKVGTMNEVVF